MSYDTALRAYTSKRIEEIESADILVGIPCYNNERTIDHVIQMVTHGLATHYKDRRSVIFIADGGSTDDSREVAKEFQIKQDDATLNPLDGADFTARKFSLRDGTYDLEVTFSSTIPLRVLACQHETFARMNTDDYKTMYQGIGLAFIHKGTDFKIDITISDSRP